MAKRKELVDPENRCQYYRTWTDEETGEKHSKQCKREKSPGHEYCYIHKKKMQGEYERPTYIELAKQMDLETIGPVPNQLNALIEHGHSQTAAAHMLGIEPSTITSWVRKANVLIAEGKVDHKRVLWYKDFLAAKYRAIGMVENALYQMAVKDHNYQAAIKWLAMRAPEEWTERKEFTIDGLLTIKNEYEQMTDRELRDMMGAVIDQTAAIMEIEPVMVQNAGT